MSGQYVHYSNSAMEDMCSVAAIFVQWCMSSV